MKKIFTLVAISLASVSLTSAQSVTGAYAVSRQDLRGSARFMSMGGAFGALGGDISVLKQNPGGIGIYRSSELAFTLDVDVLNSQSNSQGFKQSEGQTQFNLNNIGGIFSMKLPSQTMPNLNFGFTYNKIAAFNRQFRGGVPNLNISLSNYIAGLCNSNGLTEANLETTNTYDPYKPSLGQKAAPWLCIMGYDGFLVDPTGDKDNPHWYGQFGDGTTGSGSFQINEKGSVDEYNIALGGNFKDKVFWGLDVGVTSLDYRIQSVWGESLNNAYVYNPNKERTEQCSAQWSIYDNYRMYGTGVNFKLGFIVKPIQELRLGFAFHTPTFYNLTERYSDINLQFNYPFKVGYNEVWANNGYSVDNRYDFQTPWRVMVSAAGVISNFLIVSADYEWAGYNKMTYSAPSNNYGNYYDPWYDWYDPWDYWYSASRSEENTRGNVRNSYDSPYAFANSQISNVYRNTSTFRLGAEFRINKSISARAGYCYSSSPVKTEVKDGQVAVPGTGVLTSYTLDNSTNYITCGLGFKHKGFYADLAYVYKTCSADYYPFSPDVADPSTVVKSDVKFNSSQIALTMGYKF